MKYLFLTLAFTIISISSFSTTWDEPWQKEIIEKSDVFVFAKVLTASDSMITVEVTKTFESTLKGVITIDNFFLLDLCSMSGGHGPEFRFEVGIEGYFFLKEGKNGNYQIPTPTSGFDLLDEGNVHATYRHSYHKALLPVEIYELTYTEIWNKYHSDSFDSKKVESYINEQLKLAPAGFNEDEINVFFKQHAALETAYLLGIEIDFEVLIKFSEFDNFHSRISAIRAMYNVENEKAIKYLLEYIIDKEKEEFSQVIAIWTLWKMEDSKVQKRLKAMVKNLSEEETGFGGNIMDPRVCTHFPNPKLAVMELVENKKISKTLFDK